MAVAGAKTALCDRGSVSVPILVPGGSRGREHKLRLGHVIFRCSLMGRRLLGRIVLIAEPEFRWAAREMLKKKLAARDRSADTGHPIFW